MIDYEEGYYIVGCDHCTHGSYRSFDTYAEAEENRSIEGYKMVLIDGEMVDLCPDCQESNMIEELKDIFEKEILRVEQEGQTLTSTYYKIGIRFCLDRIKELESEKEKGE